MEIDLLFLSIAIPGVLIAAISKAGFGGGASFVATPILALVVDPAIAVGALLPLLIVMDAGSMRAYWRAWNVREAWRLCLGAFPGVLLAGAVFRYTDPDVFRFLIGAISIGFVLFQGAVYKGWIRRRDKPLSAAAGIGFGVGAGFTSFVAHAGGPPALMYLLSQNLPKRQFQATTVVVFTLVNLLKAGLYLPLGLFGTETWHIVLVLAPFALLGVWIGVRANTMIHERSFFAVTYLLLCLAGAKLIWDALV